jgi:hypothetical protein
MFDLLKSAIILHEYYKIRKYIITQIKGEGMKYLLFVLLLVTVLITAGCTSENKNVVVTPTQTTSQIPTTTLSVSHPTTASSMAPTTVPTVMISTTQTPVSSGLTVTLNSAVKKTTLGGITPSPGNIFLVLDVTIQNNDKNNDFEYTDTSFSIFDNLNQNRRTPITFKVAGKLNSPITSGRIPLKSTKTGQIVFGVMDSSNSYKFSVADSTGTELTSIDNINVP